MTLNERPMSVAAANVIDVAPATITPIRKPHQLALGTVDGETAVNCAFHLIYIKLSHWYQFENSSIEIDNKKGNHHAY